MLLSTREHLAHAEKETAAAADCLTEKTFLVEEDRCVRSEGDTRRSNPCTFFIKLSLRRWELTDIASSGHTLNALPLYCLVASLSHAKYHYRNVTAFS